MKRTKSVKSAFTAKQISKLIDADNTKSLDFTEKGLGDEGMKVLQQALADKKDNVVSELVLYGNNLTDVAIDTLADILAQNYRIRSVRLQFNQITKHGARKIAERIMKTSEHLQRIDLYNNKIEDEGIEHIAKALDTNRSLTNLGLYSCKISNKGATCLVRHLEKNKFIQQINIANNDIDDDLLDAIEALVARNNNETYELPDTLFDYYKKYPEPTTALDAVQLYATATTPTAKIADDSDDESEANLLEVPTHLRKTLDPTAPIPSNKTAQPTPLQKEQEKALQDFSLFNTSAIPMPKVSTLSAQDDFLIADLNKEVSERDWPKQRKQLIDKIQILLKDKDALTKHVVQLNQQMLNVQKKGAHLEQFMYTIQRGIATIQDDNSSMN